MRVQTVYAGGAIVSRLGVRLTNRAGVDGATAGVGLFGVQGGVCGENTLTNAMVDGIRVLSK